MKKIISLSVYAGLIAVLCTSCDVKSSEEYQKLQAQKDSIINIQLEKEKAIEDYAQLMSEIDSSFAVIRESQGFLSIAPSGGDLSDDMKNQITDDFYMIQTLLADNQAKIEELEAQLDQSGINSQKLRRTIALLNKQIKTKTEELVVLKAELENKNFKIDSLFVENQLVTKKADELTIERAHQDSVLAEQDAALHRAYYFMGTSREMRTNKISYRDQDAGYDKKHFTPVDIRYFEKVETKSRYVKLLTRHPENSYKMVRGNDKFYTLEIKDTEAFWSVSKYMILRVR